MSADPRSIVADLSAHPHAFHAVDFGNDAYDEAEDNGVAGAQEARTVLPSPHGANVISSAVIDPMTGRRTGKHTFMVDIDHRVRAVPSTNPDHSHLYVDVPLDWDDMVKVLRVMAEVGIVEPGYVKACESRKAAHLRLPWIRKEPTGGTS